MTANPRKAIERLLNLRVRADVAVSRRFHELLDSPVDVGSGGKIYEVIVAHTGPMEYAWGTEYVDVETLNDPAWNKSLEGLALVMKAERHNDDLDITEEYDLRVGNILSAEFVSDGNGGGVTKARVVVDNPDALALIESGKPIGVSPRYHAGTEEIDGRQVQRGRHSPNHLMLVPNPRGEAAMVRTDAGETGDNPDNGGPAMDPEALADALKPLVDALTKMREDMDHYMKGDKEEPEEPVSDEQKEAHDEAVSDAAVTRYLDATKVAEFVGVKSDGLSLRELEAAVVKASDHINSPADIAGVANTMRIVGATKPEPKPKSDAVDPLVERFGFTQPTGNRSDAGADTFTF